MFQACLPCCGVCQDIIYPDSIELDLTRGTTQYGTYSFGANPTGGPIQQFTTGIAMAYPETGVYSLSHVSGNAFSRNYEFSKSSYTLRVNIIPQFDSSINLFVKGITLQIIFRTLRAKTVEGAIAPSEEELLDDDFFVGNPGNNDYTVQRPLPALGIPAINVSIPLYPSIWVNLTHQLHRRCFFPSEVTTQLPGPDSGSFQVMPVVKQCLQPGCALPNNMAFQHQFVFFPIGFAEWPYVGTPYATGISTDLALRDSQILFEFSRSLSNLTNQVATSTLNSAKLVYGDEKVDMFPALGSAACSEYSTNFAFAPVPIEQRLQAC